MALSGSGILRDVELVDQDGEEVPYFLVEDSNGTDWGIILDYPAGWEGCNPGNPYGLIDAEISFEATDTEIPNTFWGEKPYWSAPPSDLTVLANAEIVSCPPA